MLVSLAYPINAAMASSDPLTYPCLMDMKALESNLRKTSEGKLAGARKVGAGCLLVLVFR